MADPTTPRLADTLYTATPKSYDAFPKEGPSAETRGLAAAVAAEAISRRAVWVTHGMGQQIPFETLDTVTRGLADAAERAGSPRPQPRVRVVRIGEQTLRRVEINVKDHNQREHELHLYEAYWAPLTEGAVKLRDVLRFLWTGGSRGILKGRKFERILFGKVVMFPLSWRTPTYIACALALVAALGVINAIVAGVGVSLTTMPAEQQKFTPEQYQALTALASIVTMVAISFGALLYLGQLEKHSRDRQRVVAAIGRKSQKIPPGRDLRGVVWTAFVLTSLLLLLTAPWMAWIAWCKRVPEWLTETQAALRGYATILVLLSIVVVLAARYRPRKRIAAEGEGVLTFLGSRQAENPLLPLLFWIAGLLHLAAYVGPIVILIWFRQEAAPHTGGSPEDWWHLSWAFLASSKWVWPFLFGLSALVRKLIVQYVGDVAAYVDSSTVDQFEKLREEIKEKVRKAATAVYLAKAEEKGRVFEYDKVAIAGHSLGSVIAYETLNRLINDDGLAGGTLQVVKRTSVLLTFGSPLDKTAFFFTVQGKDTGRIRERLATAVQPLIQDPNNRIFPWINVWSGSDIISGSLDFYDDRDPVTGQQTIPPPGRIVQNVPDPEALIPLVAHTDYWRNRAVWDCLLREILR